MMMNFEQYGPCFEQWRGKRAAYFRPIGNVGDRVIDLATRQLFRHFEITECESSTADVFFWAGGGNMGNLYLQSRQRRMRASMQAREMEKPFVVLPQSWNAIDDPLGYLSFARERESLNFSPSSLLAPDLALAYVPDWTIPKAVEDEGCFFRQDIERSAFSISEGDPAKMVNGPVEYIQLAAKYRKIHTDRLHFAIAGMISGREVILYPNSYHKNRSMWETWLKDLGCGFAEF